VSAPPFPSVIFLAVVLPQTSLLRASSPWHTSPSSQSDRLPNSSINLDFFYPQKKNPYVSHWVDSGEMAYLCNYEALYAHSGAVRAPPLVVDVHWSVQAFRRPRVSRNRSFLADSLALCCRIYAALSLGCLPPVEPFLLRHHFRYDSTYNITLYPFCILPDDTSSLSGGMGSLNTFQNARALLHYQLLPPLPAPSSSEISRPFANGQLRYLKVESPPSLTSIQVLFLPTLERMAIQMGAELVFRAKDANYCLDERMGGLAATLVSSFSLARLVFFELALADDLVPVHYISTAGSDRSSFSRSRRMAPLP
jgi:hypothetical protein